MTVAELLVARLRRCGTRALFGMPGGGSNLDMIEAARRQGMRFVLVHTETAGAIMAAAQAEITGAPGACLSTLGPGVSSITNGVAHAWLDRVPLVVLTDAMERSGRDRFEHQNLRHAALLGPIARWSTELTAENAADVMETALARACGDPPGPVHVDCVQSVMAAQVPEHDAGDPRPAAQTRVDGPAASAALSDDLSRLLADARRPLILAGLGARRADDVAALRGLCDRHALPVLVTYKAKGVVPDGHPSYAGLFTLGEIERTLVERADVLIAVGLDPVELLPRPWCYAQPVVHCARWPPGPQLPGGHRLIGDIASSLHAIEECLPHRADWSVVEIAAHRDQQRAAVMTESSRLSPGTALAVVADETRTVRHVTVDAGAHMFPAMALAPADCPGRILISNGLSTMGYALPAAIGAALLAPADPVLAITGDAGLLLCLGELRTAVRERLRVVVLVMADGELSLIRIKQDRRGLQRQGVSIGEMDWPAVARGMGCHGSRARSARELGRQLRDAVTANGPSLIEARVDPSGYGEMLRAVRG
jgi:acetolactate synthase-1/2/3 large subunit